MLTPNTLDIVLTALGDVLEARGHSFDVVVVGGGALMLVGLIARSTDDLDVAGIVENGTVRTAIPFPEPLREAIADVARNFELPEEWMDNRFSQQLQLGLPQGFLARTEQRRYGALTLRLADRIDQIYLKLYADADQRRGGKHHVDLRRLAPSETELRSAATWVRSQERDPSVIDVRLREIMASFGVVETDDV